MASFKSVLKKIGEVTLKVTEQLVGVEGIAALVFPQKADTIHQVVDKFEQLAGIVVTAEQMGAALALGGPDKLKMATPLLGQVILQSQLLAGGRKIRDAAKFQAGVAALGGALADIMNSLSDDGIESADKAA